MNQANKIAIMVKAQQTYKFEPQVIFIDNAILQILEDNPEPCDPPDLNLVDHKFCGIPYEASEVSGIYLGYKLVI